jgi:hypothetical protein
MLILDAKLSTTVSQRAIIQPRLDAYRRAMRAFQTQYDGTDAALEIVENLMHHIRVDTPSKASHLEINLNMGVTQETILPSGSSKSLRKVPCSSVIYNWGDLLLRQPRCYVRFVLAIYFSLGNGRVPQDTDFPDSLQLRGRGMQSPMFRILTTETEAAAENELRDMANKTLGWEQRAEAINRPGKESFLDSAQYRFQESLNRDSVHLPHTTDAQEIDPLAYSELLLDYAAFNSRTLGSANPPEGNSSLCTDEMLLFDFPVL